MVCKTVPFGATGFESQRRHHFLSTRGRGREARHLVPNQDNAGSIPAGRSTSCGGPRVRGASSRRSLRNVATVKRGLDSLLPLHFMRAWPRRLGTGLPSRHDAGSSPVARSKKSSCRRVTGARGAPSALCRHSSWADLLAEVGAGRGTVSCWGVVQLAERTALDRDVGGSSPSAPAISRPSGRIGELTALGAVRRASCAPGLTGCSPPLAGGSSNREDAGLWIRMLWVRVPLPLPLQLHSGVA